MKCPKCHYLSFDPEPRCRNCGFSLGLDADLPIASDAESGVPPADLELRRPPVLQSAEPEAAGSDRLEGTLGVSERRPRPARRIASVPRAVGASAAGLTGGTGPTHPAAARSASPTSELPLFVKDIAEAGETVPEPPVPVAPVSVVEQAAAVSGPPDSRSTPTLALVTPEPQPTPVPVSAHRVSPLSDTSATIVPRASLEPEPERAVPIVADRPAMWRATSTPRTLGPLDQDLLKDLDTLAKRESERASALLEAEERRRQVAGRGRRLLAAAIDGLVLAAIIAGLLAVTLRWTALTLETVLALPMWPLAVFLVLVGYFYLLLFTAATGQTPGKMVAGIRVVDAGETGDRSDPLRAGQACLREIVALPAVLAFGLGFLPALVGDARGVHDRVAATRVVRE